MGAPVGAIAAAGIMYNKRERKHSFRKKQTN